MLNHRFDLLDIVLVAALTFVIGAYVFNPVQQTVDHVGEVKDQIGYATGLQERRCQNGWKDTTTSVETETTETVHSCFYKTGVDYEGQDTGWLVVLDEDQEDGFAYAMPIGLYGKNQINTIDELRKEVGVLWR